MLEFANKIFSKINSPYSQSRKTIPLNNGKDFVMTQLSFSIAYLIKLMFEMNPHINISRNANNCQYKERG
jgi:hypothetical protein